MMKKAMGWNFCPDTLGESIMKEIIEEVRAGHVKPVIGETISFEELPAAMARLRDRKTTGRIIAQLEPHHS